MHSAARHGSSTAQHSVAHSTSASPTVNCSDALHFAHSVLRGGWKDQATQTELSGLELCTPVIMHQQTLAAQQQAAHSYWQLTWCKWLVEEQHRLLAHQRWLTSQATAAQEGMEREISRLREAAAHATLRSTEMARKLVEQSQPTGDEAAGMTPSAARERGKGSKCSLCPSVCGLL